MQVYRLFISRREEDALWRQRLELENRPDLIQIKPAKSSKFLSLLWAVCWLQSHLVSGGDNSARSRAQTFFTFTQTGLTSVFIRLNQSSSKVCPRDRLQRAQESFFHKHGNHPGHDFMQPTMRKKNKACKCKTLISNRSFSHQTWKCWRSQFRSSFSLTHRQPAVDAHFCHLHLNVDESQSQVHQFILFEYLIWIQI